MNNSYQAPRGRLLSTLLVFCFAIGLLYTFFLIFKQATLKGDISELVESSETLETKIDTLKRKKIEELFIAQEIKNKVEASRVEWSGVIRDLQSLTPVTVFFNSMSGGDAGLLTLSGLSDSASSVADLIRALDESEDFSDVFVPSITQGRTSDGQSVVSFNLSINTQ